MQVNVFPDKLYMLYIIVFYRWMSMENNADAKEKIIDLAESFMKPAATLASNKLYAIHLPSYKTYSTATRYILNNLNCYKDIRSVSKKKLNKILVLPIFLYILHIVNVKNETTTKI